LGSTKIYSLAINLASSGFRDLFIRFLRRWI
jgi:hypothetical protein